MTQVFSVISSCIVDECVGRCVTCIQHNSTPLTASTRRLCICLSILVVKQICKKKVQHSCSTVQIGLVLRRHWPVRSYPWGTAEALSSSHSDVPALKRLLIELSFDDIKVLEPLQLNPCLQLPSAFHSFAAEYPQRDTRASRRVDKGQADPMEHAREYQVGAVSDMDVCSPGVRAPLQRLQAHTEAAYHNFRQQRLSRAEASADALAAEGESAIPDAAQPYSAGSSSARVASGDPCRGSQAWEVRHDRVAVSTSYALQTCLDALACGCSRQNLAQILCAMLTPKARLPQVPALMK